jgi:hypothetical protein
MKYLKNFNESLLYEEKPIDDLEFLHEIPMSPYEKKEILKFFKIELPSFRIEEAGKNHWRIISKVENYVAGLFSKVDDDWFYVQLFLSDDVEILYKCDDLIGIKKLLKDKENLF